MFTTVYNPFHNYVFALYSAKQNGLSFEIASSGTVEYIPWVLPNSIHFNQNQMIVQIGYEKKIRKGSGSAEHYGTILDYCREMRKTYGENVCYKNAEHLIYYSLSFQVIVTGHNYIWKKYTNEVNLNCVSCIDKFIKIFSHILNMTD